MQKAPVVAKKIAPTKEMKSEMDIKAYVKANRLVKISTQNLKYTNEILNDSNIKIRFYDIPLNTYKVYEESGVVVYRNSRWGYTIFCPG